MLFLSALSLKKAKFSLTMTLFSLRLVRWHRLFFLLLSYSLHQPTCPTQLRCLFTVMTTYSLPLIHRDDYKFPTMIITFSSLAHCTTMSSRLLQRQHFLRLSQTTLSHIIDATVPLRLPTFANANTTCLAPLDPATSRRLPTHSHCHCSLSSVTLSIRNPFFTSSINHVGQVSCRLFGSLRHGCFRRWRWRRTVHLWSYRYRHSVHVAELGYVVTHGSLVFLPLTKPSAIRSRYCSSTHLTVVLSSTYPAKTTIVGGVNVAVTNNLIEWGVPGKHRVCLLTFFQFSFMDLRSANNERHLLLLVPFL